MKESENTLHNVNQIPEINQRILQLLADRGVSAYKLEKDNSGIKQSQISHLKSGRNKPSDQLIENLLKYFPDVDEYWLLTGIDQTELNARLSGKPLTPPSPAPAKAPNPEPLGQLVPLYDDVVTIGGNLTTDLSPVSEPSEYIEAGTWFGSVQINAAIRHYGESMCEYPNGCILALKEIMDFDNVVWGRNYVVETDEIRVTKRIQSGESEDCITAYSTNRETYPDGRQIHEPFKIRRQNIVRIYLVIGRIVKENGAGSLIKI